MFGCFFFVLFHEETSKFQYSVGTIYSYDYTGETASKIGGTSDDESRLHINAQADFEIVSQCEFVLRVSRRNLFILFPLKSNLFIYFN